MSARWGLAIAAIVLAALLAIFLLDDMNRASLTGSDGYIDSGEKFGIEIGLPTAEAARILQSRGLMPGEPSTPGRCLSRDYAGAGQTVTLWEDRSWRRAVVCVGAADGRVSGIGWAIGGWQL